MFLESFNPMSSQGTSISIKLAALSAGIRKKSLNALGPEYWLRHLAFALVLMSFALGVLLENQVLCIAFVLFAGAYQLIRMYAYFYGSIRWIKKSNTFMAPFVQEIQPKVSIIVPCFNEEAVILHSLNSLDKISYDNLEIIVSDDGSTDQTFELAQAFSQNSKHQVLVITQKNSGKATALNHAIHRSSGEFLLCVDADSVVSDETITSGLSHLLSDESIVAVAGAVHVANEECLLTGYQSLEYSIGDLQKAALSNFGLVNVIPGPVGLFRRSALERVGGYETENTTFAEDTELTLRLIANGGRVVFEPKMISYTEVPDGFSPLIRQRYRWTRGIYQALRKNVELMTSDRSKQMKSFAFYLAMEKIWTPVMDFCLLVFFLAQFLIHAKAHLFFGYNAVVFASELILLMVASWYSQRNFLSHTIILVLSRFTFSILITTWKFLSLNEEWMQVRMNWDKLERKGISLQDKVA